MSYTNQTQHYGLPQYVGTDVPAWLTDINGAFAAIDNGINAAKVQADSAATAAGQAANDITSLQSTVGTQATQISAAAQAAATAQSTANTADGKADALDERVSTLEQAGRGADFVIVNIPFTGAISTASGSMFVSANISYQHPAGYDKGDIVSCEFVGNYGAFCLLGDYINLVREISLNVNGTVRVYYLKHSA